MICIKIQTDYSERVETGGVSHIHYWNILGVLSRSCLCVWTDLNEKWHKKNKKKRICVQNNEVNMWMNPVWPPADGWCSRVIKLWMHESPSPSFFYRILRSVDSLSRSNSFKKRHVNVPVSTSDVSSLWTGPVGAPWFSRWARHQQKLLSGRFSGALSSGSHSVNNSLLTGDAFRNSWGLNNNRHTMKINISLKDSESVQRFTPSEQRCSQ